MRSRPAQHIIPYAAGRLYVIQGNRSQNKQTHFHPLSFDFVVKKIIANKESFVAIIQLIPLENEYFLMGFTRR